MYLLELLEIDLGLVVFILGGFLLYGAISPYKRKYRITGKAAPDEIKINIDEYKNYTQ